MCCVLFEIGAVLPALRWWPLLSESEGLDLIARGRRDRCDIKMNSSCGSASLSLSAAEHDEDYKQTRNSQYDSQRNQSSVSRIVRTVARQGTGCDGNQIGSRRVSASTRRQNARSKENGTAYTKAVTESFVPAVSLCVMLIKCCSSGKET